MKKYYFTLLISIAALFNSCIHDFEEGNDFSFRTFNQRLTNQWKLDGIWINGIDSTGYYPYNHYTNPSNFRMILSKQQTNEGFRYFEFNRGKNGYTSGEWDFRKNNNQIILRYAGGGFGIISFYGSSVGKVICCKNKRLIIESKLDTVNGRTIKLLYTAL